MSRTRAIDYVIDLRGVQSVALPERGIPRYLVNLTDALAERSDIGVLMGIVDPSRPLPALSPVFGRRAGFGSADAEPVGLPPAGARPVIHHIGSPFELQLRRPDLEPQWLRERSPLTAVSLFDVIPALQPETFPPWAQSLWRARVELLRSADVVLCISQYTADDGVRHLDLDPARVVVVGTGVPSAVPGPASPPPALPGVREPFVMYTGGSDHPRKNIPALVRAFGRVPAGAREGVQLVIATRVTDSVRAELSAVARRAGVADAVVITGFVSDADLAALYRSCVCMAYPSLYEGFGLPIVEAMSHGAPVIASSTTSCGEIHEHESGRFDPADEQDIAAALERVLTSPRLRDQLRAYGLGRARDFTWDAVAERTVEACRAALPGTAGARRARRSRPCLFAVPGRPGLLTPQSAFAQIAQAARALDSSVEVLTDDDPPAARGTPLLVSALEAMPVCLIHDAASARVAADALPRVGGIAVVWELDSLLAPEGRAPGVPAADPYLLAALHHARRVVVASMVDAWRIVALAGRALAAPPVVAEMPLELAPAPTPPAGTRSLALLRPERLGALGAGELSRLAQLLLTLPPGAAESGVEVVACLGSSADDLRAAAAAAGVALAVCHPDDAALLRAAGAAIHLDVAGATHSASLFSAAAAMAAGRPLVVAGSAASVAGLRGAEGEPAAGGGESGTRRRQAEVARTLLGLTAEVDPRCRPSRVRVAASLIA